MRSVWKGHIRFSLVTIPIQVFSAVEKKNNISFKQLHNEDNSRIGYKKVCKSCDKEVPYGDIVKGYEYEPDQYVVIKPEELANIKLKSTRAIDIEAFVDIDEVHPTRFEAIYFVGPNGEIAQKTFALFSNVLKKTKKAGIGRIILRDKEDVVLITPHEDALIMYKLRFPYEVRDVKDVPDIGSAEVNESEMKLAETLVESLSTTFDKVDFEDRYKDALMELVNSKIEGKEIVSISDGEEEKPVVDIMSALKASIDAAKKKSA